MWLVMARQVGQSTCLLQSASRAIAVSSASKGSFLTPAITRQLEARPLSASLFNKFSPAPGCRVPGCLFRAQAQSGGPGGLGAHRSASDKNANRKHRKQLFSGLRQYCSDPACQVHSQVHSYSHSDHSEDSHSQCSSEHHHHEGEVEAHSHSNGHSHDHSHDHSHSHSHAHTHSGCGHCHSHSQDPAALNPVQRGVLAVAKAVGLTRLVEVLHDNLAVALAACTVLGAAVLLPKVVAAAWAAKVSAGLVGVTFALVGPPAVLDMVVDVAGLRVNIHVLTVLAAFASAFMGSSVEGALLLCLFNLSHTAEEALSQRARTDVNALEELSPEEALVLPGFDPLDPPPMSDLAPVQTAVKQIKVGSYLLVRAGETVPLDGLVAGGKSLVTLEHLTGESQPVKKRVGDSVPGGARNTDGVLIVKVGKGWADSTVQRIVRLTAEAEAGRPQLQRWLDAFGERYSQVVMLASLAVAALGPVAFGWPLWTTEGTVGSIYRAIGLMVAAAPCAFSMAPLSYVAAISACARRGVLLRGGQALDALAQCDTVAFDKTGTLTTGELRCTSIQAVHGHGGTRTDPPHGKGGSACCTPSCEMEALAVAAAMEQAATHPIARAVIEHSTGKDLPEVEVTEFESVAGEGLMATVCVKQRHSRGKQPLEAARLGSLNFVAGSPTMGADIRRAAAGAGGGLQQDSVLAALSVGGKVTLFRFEDKLRPHMAAVVRALEEQAGLKTLMLTGDNDISAQSIGGAVGIEQVHANLKPEDKLARVAELSKRGPGAGLLMVGDGINDAPALAAATVGLVLAERASATAIAAADVLLLQDDMERIPFVVAKARQTVALTKQSVALALLCMGVASLPALAGTFPLWLTVLVHEGSTVLVCLNALRALRDPPQYLVTRHASSAPLADRSSTGPQEQAFREAKVAPA